VAAVAGDALPVPPRLGFYPRPLLISAAYGLLIAMVFALAPLARARSVPAASLFRAGIGRPQRPPLAVLAGVALLAALIGALAILTSDDIAFAAMFVSAAALLLGLLYGLGGAVQALAARLPRPRRPLLRLAIANLHRPGAQTSRLVVALGLGLSLFATLAVIESNLSNQIERSVPKRAPSFFVLDIPSTDIDRFQDVVERHARGAELITVPSLRGPIVAIGKTRVADMKSIPEGAWFLRGDRGLTYATDLPEGSRVVEGKWWPRDYAGPPLVSMDVEAARLLGLKIGDQITVSVLGVEVPATIASLRQINWDTLGFNFVLIFSPNALAGAPHSLMATIAMPEAGETALSRTLSGAFPSISMIRVKDVIDRRRPARPARHRGPRRIARRRRGGDRGADRRDPRGTPIAHLRRGAVEAAGGQSRPDPRGSRDRIRGAGGRRRADSAHGRERRRLVCGDACAGAGMGSRLAGCAGDAGDGCHPDAGPGSARLASRTGGAPGAGAAGAIAYPPC
jgi:putative ABC transport system permease protein